MRGLMLPLVILACVISVLSGIEPAAAQDRSPSARDVSRIRACVDKNRDDLDEGERQCLFKLVSDPCVKRSDTSNHAVIDCHETELKIWDDLLNATYKKLRDGLDEPQREKLRKMQQTWIAYRDTTCEFYYDKIQGTMAGPMGAACRTRETARRAMLLGFFTRL